MTTSESVIFSISRNLFQRELTEVLERAGFQVTHDRVITHPPIRAVILNIAKKNNVLILYQKETIPSYIGAAGRDKREVIKQFHSLDNVLSSLDPTLHSRQADIELVITTKVYGKELPKKTIGSFCSSNLEGFNSLFDTKMRTFSITLESDESRDYYSLTLSPLYRSPRYYHVQLVNRNKDLTKVLHFTDRAEQIINDAITSIEGT